MLDSSNNLACLLTWKRNSQRECCAEKKGLHAFRRAHVVAAFMFPVPTSQSFHEAVQNLPGPMESALSGQWLNWPGHEERAFLFLKGHYLLGTLFLELEAI